MSWNIVRLDDARATPWRNGGGSTRELVAWPTSAQWRWRMSVATIDASGPFSRFDGISRWFAVLKSAGVRLTVDDAEHDLRSNDAPICFDGGAAIQCRLVGDATEDFNLMVNTAAGRAHMERVEGTLEAHLNAAVVIAVYAVDAVASVTVNAETMGLEPATLAWCHATAGTVVRVSSTNALWMEIAA